MNNKIYKTINGVVALEDSIDTEFYISMIFNSITIIGSLFLFKPLVQHNLILGIIIFLVIFLRSTYYLLDNYYLYYTQKNITELYLDNILEKIIIKYKSKLNNDFEKEIQFLNLIKVEEGNGSTYNLMSRLAYGKKITLYVEKTIYIFSMTQEITEEDYFELYKLLNEIVENNSKQKM